jgi:hypothetical protein
VVKRVSLGSTDKIRIYPPSKNARTQNSSGKLMAAVFWDMEGILLIEYMKKGSTITVHKARQMREVIDERGFV